MPVHNTLDSSQPDASAFKCLWRMKTLEDAEQFIGILHIEPDSIIQNE